MKIRMAHGMAPLLFVVNKESAAFKINIGG